MHRNNRMSNPQPGVAGQAGQYLNDISGENVPNGVPTLVGSSRLSPDSGRGSDKTGSDTSNSYNVKITLKELWQEMLQFLPVQLKVPTLNNPQESTWVRFHK